GSRRAVPAPWEPPRPEGAEVLPFRRRPGLPVRRRRRALGLLRHFAVALALVGTPAAALWWSATSPRFDLAELEVTAAERVNRAWVEERLAPLLGRNLVWMSMASVERSLADHPWIAGVEVSKGLPARLSVAVVERRPVAVLRAADGSRHYVDRTGHVIAPVGAEGEPPVAAGRAGGYLVIAERRALPDRERSSTRTLAPTLARTLEAARDLSRVNPGWGSSLTEVEILGEEDFRLKSRELPFPLVVEAGTVERRVRALADRVPEILARVPEPGEVDLRFEHRMIVRPAAAGEPATGPDDGRGEDYGETG
ncbi:MAG TPA: FtsQ-type POTRA domain-containing protein, partial [Thermoanaerobaculia bacterium]|nr:FtsQ-type POTRA domain-containing protein [Thermoanaerobaculia bacterium]